MRLIAFILLICIAGSYGITDECFSKYDKKCGDMPIDFRIPDNGEELDIFCSQLISLGNCRREVQETCEDVRDQRELRIFAEVMDYVETSCNSDNEVYKVVLNNLKCMKLSAENVYNSCGYFDLLSKARKDVVESYRQRLSPEGNVTNKIYRCMYGIWKSACTAITVGEICGQEMKNTIMDISTNTEYMIRMYCTDAEIELIPEFIEDFENANNEIDTQENGIEDKK